MFLLTKVCALVKSVYNTVVPAGLSIILVNGRVAELIVKSDVRFNKLRRSAPSNPICTEVKKHAGDSTASITPSLSSSMSILLLMPSWSVSEQNAILFETALTCVDV